MKIVYVPPVFEQVQHEPTLLGDNGEVKRASLHSDVSLLMRIDSLKCDANTISLLKQNLQPMIDSSNFKQQFEDSFGKLTDTELIESCPSRYIQTRTEQMQFLKSLAQKDKEARAKYTKSLQDKEEQERSAKEGEEFRKRIQELFK
jgi:hypothetical protein